MSSSNSSYYDTVVVGARCAGAALAIQLARAGQKVLLLDAAKLPSDQPLSTHFVQAAGVAYLDELGVGQAIRKLTPASAVMRLDLDGLTIDVPVPGGRAGHCVRRLHLDRLLQDTAVAAGVTLQDSSKVTGLLSEAGRVTGVHVESGGATRTVRAQVVVGADGRNSSVARFAGAEEYRGYDGPRFMYWSYFRPRPGWKERAHFTDCDACIGFSTDRRVRFVFQTDDGLVLLAVAPLLSELPDWKGRHEARYLEALQSSPVTASIAAEGERSGDLLGILRMRHFFRRAAGPGFALVGDAGLHKDPVPGLGITDALRDARNLAPAILKGSQEALTRYWRQRDVDSIDLFHFAADLGSEDYVNPLNRLVFEHVRRQPALIARLAAGVDRQISPYEALAPHAVMGWVLGAVLRGTFSVVPSFIRRIGHEIAVQRARSECQKHLKSVPVSAPVELALTAPQQA